MSVVPSLNTILSLLSFLTVIFALARVGAAAFSANQAQDSSPSVGASSSRSASPPTRSQTHRSWHLSKAVAAPAAHLLQVQLAGGRPAFGSPDTGRGIPALLRFGPSTPSMTLPMSMSMPFDLAQAIRYGLVASEYKGKEGGMRDTDSGKEKRKGDARGVERERDKKMHMVEYIGGHELVRMPATSWTGQRRPGLLFRPPSPSPDQTEPLSMAKLIMSRHNQRRTNRPPAIRRPPGLPPLPTSRSRLVEEV